jgi:hypothetical protein
MIQSPVTFVYKKDFDLEYFILEKKEYENPVPDDYRIYLKTFALNALDIFDSEEKGFSGVYHSEYYGYMARSAKSLYSALMEHFDFVVDEITRRPDDHEWEGLLFKASLNAMRVRTILSEKRLTAGRTMCLDDYDILDETISLLSTYIDKHYIASRHVFRPMRMGI